MTMTASQVRELREKNIKDRKRKGGGDWLQVQEGAIWVRFGPPWHKGGEVWKDRFFHGRYPNKIYCGRNDVDEATGKRRACKICKRVKALEGSKDAFSKALWGLLKQKRDHIWNVAVAKTKEVNGRTKVIGLKTGKFQIWSLAAQWHDALLDIFADEDYREASILGVVDTRHGRFIRVTRTGTDIDTEYTFKAAKDESLLAGTKEERLAILKTLNDLDTIVSGSSGEEMDAFLQAAEKEARKKSKAAKKSRDEDESEEEEEEEETEDEEEEEEEEAPKKKKKAKDEDEEEEEDEGEDSDDADSDEEEEEEEAPKKKKKKAEDDDDEEEAEDEEEDDDDSEDEADKTFREMKRSLHKKKKKAKATSDDDDQDEPF